jgi:hypothetical protein
MSFQERLIVLWLINASFLFMRTYPAGRNNTKVTVKKRMRLFDNSGNILLHPNEYTSIATENAIQ